MLLVVWLDEGGDGVGVWVFVVGGLWECGGSVELLVGVGLLVWGVVGGVEVD